jgi:hypothetical protein
MHELTERIGNRAVRVGDIWLTPNHVTKSISRYGRLLFCLTGNPEHPYTFRGSAVGLCWHSLYAVFFCHHQVRNVDPTSIVFPATGSGTFLISGHTYVTTEATGKDEEVGDLRGMFFSLEDYSEESIERTFFKIQKADLWGGDKDSLFVVFGYPTDLRDLDLHDETAALKHVRSTIFLTGAHYRSASSASGVHRIEMQRNIKVDTDGMSGGAVFHLSQDAQGFYVGFAGIILRGGSSSDNLHFLDARALMAMFAKQELSEKR